MESLLKGAYDLHIHCGPDVVARAVTGLEMARRAAACGMKGFALKSHYSCTCLQAETIKAVLPECDVVGTLVLNGTVGGINPAAVENAVRMGARIVWCPTFDSRAQQEYYLKNCPQYIVMQKKLLDRGIPVDSYSLLDEDGVLSQKMRNVLDLVVESNICLATGHITHKEAFALAREAKRRNYKKLLVTHADWNFTHYSIDEQKELCRMGAFIEHSYTSPAEGAVAWNEVFNEIRSTGVDRVILSTDLGQAKNTYPDLGFQDYAERILEAGFSREELNTLIASNTAYLVEK